MQSARRLERGRTTMTDDRRTPAMDRRAFLYSAGAATAAVGLGGWWALQSGGAGAASATAAPADHGAHAGHVPLDRSGFRYAEGSREYASTNRTGGPRKVARK